MTPKPVKPVKQKHPKNRISKQQLNKTLPSKPELSRINDCVVDSILAVPIQCADDAEMITNARTALQLASQSDNLSIITLSDTVAVANPRGETIMERADEYRRNRDALKTINERLHNLEQDHQNLKKDYQNLEKGVSSLNSPFRELRHRFISTYKRDVLQNADRSDHIHIMFGNKFAQFGDCKRDAELYEPSYLHVRTDPDVFEQLYGLSPTDIAAISEFINIGT